MSVAVVNPYCHSIIAEVKLDSEAEAMNKLRAAYNLYRDRKSWLSKKERLDILKKTYQILLRKRDQIITTAIKEGGKPYKDTVIEFERGLDGIDIAIKELFHFKGEVINMELNESSMNRHAFTIKEPRGVMLAISAFNHPFNLIIHQVIPAVAVGCPVLIKPALKTPLTARLVVDALIEAGLPEKWCQYLLLENDITEKLVQNSMVSFMSFIGSARVGWYLRSKLAAGASCSLEHGGIAPVIVDSSVNVQQILPNLVRGSFYHAGQVCVSVQRIFVHDSLLDDFARNMVDLVKDLRTGDPTLAETDVGPLISFSEVNRVDAMVKEAVALGAKVLIGAKKISSSLYEPTILLEPKASAKVSSEEIFGPVVCLYGFSDLADAIKRANNTDNFFQAAIFSNDINRSFIAAQALDACAVMINDHTAFRVDWMPFGGHRQSGLGVGGIPYAMEDMCIAKMLVIKLPEQLH